MILPKPKFPTLLLDLFICLPVYSKIYLLLLLHLGYDPVKCPEYCNPKNKTKQHLNRGMITECNPSVQ